MNINCQPPLQFVYFSTDTHIPWISHNTLRDRLFKNGVAIRKKVSTGATYIYDGIALYKRLKPESSYREWVTKLLREAKLLPAEYNATVVNDLYWKISTKNDTRLARGDCEESCRVRLKGIDQKMLRGTDLDEFFHNGEDKEDLIVLVCSF